VIETNITEITILKGNKIRLYPTIAQQRLFWRYVGASRWAYNFYLNLRERVYKRLNKVLTVNQISAHITQLKKREKYAWLNEIPLTVIKVAFRDVDTAFQNFYKNIKKGYAFEDAGFPTYKSRKKSRASFAGRYDQIHILCGEVKAYQSFLGKIKCRNNSNPTSDLKNPRFIFDNKYWFITYATPTNETQVSRLDTTLSIGIDLGLKDLAVLSNGTVYKNINKSKQIKQLERRKLYLERRRSRKYNQAKKQAGKYTTSKNIQKLTAKINLINKLQYKKNRCWKIKAKRPCI